jgi:3-hydroxyisobutyrate dehydrogenase
VSDACTVTVNGAGALGAAMAARLAETGHQVRLWNRTPAKARPGRTTPTSIHLMH